MKKFLLLAVSVIILSSCGSTNTNINTLYSWYDYENITYQYNKKTTDGLQVNVLEQYKKVIDKQNGVRGVVPPGLYAEYGYLLFKTGKKEEGLAFMKEETKLYPESEKYISRIIKQLEK